MTPLWGRSGARYVVSEHPAAAGSRALVYRGVAQDDHRPVAVRVARGSGADGEWMDAQVRASARLAGLPAGQHVVAVWDDGRWDGRPFQVLDWFEHTLETWSPTRSTAHRCGVLADLARAVTALHAAGVIHGHVTPSHVLIRDDDEDEDALVTPFLTCPGAGSGTPGYTAPEVADGAPPTAASDRFGLAATAWDALTGAPPTWPHESRPPSGAERDAFDRAVAGRPGLRRALEDLLRPPATRAADLRGLLQALRGEAPPEPRPRPWPLGASAVLVLLLVLGMAWLGGPERPPPSCPAPFVARDGACAAPDGRQAVVIPAGTFDMGGAWNEHIVDSPRRRVVLSRAFLLDRAEVTQAEWTARMGANPVEERIQLLDGGVVSTCATWHGHVLVGGELPVVCVSWDDAIDFANARSIADHLRPAYHRVHGRVEWDRSANGWRLPTEAEWEWAARAGSERVFGDAPHRESICAFANVRDQSAPEHWGNEVACSDGAPVLTRAGRYPPNAWGLRDMAGNAMEWVWDPYGRYPHGTLRDPSGPAWGATRVQRGGSWNHVAKGLPARYASAPSDFSYVSGVRLARDLP